MLHDPVTWSCYYILLQDTVTMKQNKKIQHHTKSLWLLPSTIQTLMTPCLPQDWTCLCAQKVASIRDRNPELRVLRQIPCTARLRKDGHQAKSAAYVLTCWRYSLPPTSISWRWTINSWKSSRDTISPAASCLLLPSFRKHCIPSRWTPDTKAKPPEACQDISIRRRDCGRLIQSYSILACCLKTSGSFLLVSASKDTPPRRFAPPCFVYPFFPAKQYWPHFEMYSISLYNAAKRSGLRMNSF